MTRFKLSLLCVLPLLAVPLFAAPTPQTRPWRIAIGGGYCTGYLGICALHGYPRERLDDSEFTDLNRLKQFDIVITGWRTSGSAAAMQTLEEYARQGGVVLTEMSPPPSQEVLPGQRLGPAAAPNVVFVDSGTPITDGLPQLGVIRCAGLRGVSIIPDASAKAVVLARYTDEGAPRRCQGHFVENGQGTPAIIMVNVGKGKIIYAGTSIAFSLALRGTQFEPFVCNLLKYISGGQIADRFNPQAIDHSELVSGVPQQALDQPYPTPPGKAIAPPPDFETLEQVDGLRDFSLTAALPASGQARLLVSYWSPQWYRELRFTKGRVELLRITAGKTADIASARVAPGSKLNVTRTSGLLTLSEDSHPVLTACDGPLAQGVLAQQGLKNAEYQPLEPVNFDDDFMRETSYQGEWKQVTGTWRITAAEGQPDMGANPFDYEVDTPDTALSTNGEWFWRNYQYQAAVKGDGEAVGIISNYAGPSDYLLLRLVFSADRNTPSKLQMVRHTASGDKVLAEAPVTAHKGDWNRLALRTSRGVLEGLLNGKVVLRAEDDTTSAGLVGLVCEKGNGSFDDVRVTPWMAVSDTSSGLSEFTGLRGRWSASRNGELITGSSRDGARAFVPFDANGNCLVSTEVNPARAAAAGVYVDYSSPQDYSLVALVGDGNHVKLRIYRRGQPGGGILAERALPGARNQWRHLTVTTYGQRLAAFVDGRKLVQVADVGPDAGSAGLYVRGAREGQFRGFATEDLSSDEHLADELTPTFAGILDRHTWAGRSGAWSPDPAHLNTLWHLGYFPDDVDLQVGLHKGTETALDTRLYLSPRFDRQGGYMLEAQRTWDQPAMSLVLSRQGQPVAHAEAKVEPGQAYAIGLERCGNVFIAEVNHSPLLVYTDSKPLSQCDSLGVDNGGIPLYPDDLAVSTPQVHDYTFDTAPTDWTVESGTWKVSSRWSCTPGWAWFAGYNEAGPAMIATKQSYVGDQEVITYVAAKMMPEGGNRHYEKLVNIHVGFCADNSNADSGYQFVLSGNDNTWTGLQKNGKTVATCDYRIPQTNIHNDWLRLTFAKRGNEISLYAWDTLVMKYTDPQPLSGGRVALGTNDNGILIPRVTIYGQQAQPPASPLLLAAKP